MAKRRAKISPFSAGLAILENNFNAHVSVKGLPAAKDALREKGKSGRSTRTEGKIAVRQSEHPV